MNIYYGSLCRSENSSYFGKSHDTLVICDQDLSQNDVGIAKYYFIEHCSRERIGIAIEHEI